MLVEKVEWKLKSEKISYLLDIISNSLKIFLLRRWRIYAVSSRILFKHQIWNPSCSVIQLTFVNFELNTFPFSLQHLHSLSVCRMTQWLWQLHQCKFSNLQSWTKIIWATAKNGVVTETTSNVQSIQKTICRQCKGTLLYL